MFNTYFRLALTMAQKSTSKYRLGAVVVKRGKTVSTGFNQMKKTHPLMNRLNPAFTMGIHAEIHACLGLSRIDLMDSDIYVARIFKDGTPALAKPCAVCQKFLTSVGISEVYFTTGDSRNPIEHNRL